jgi:rubrerythrin
MFTLPQGYPSDISGAFGVLKTRQSLSLDDMRVLAVIEAAGEEFYLRIARSVRNAEAAALLIQNGREERGHAHRLLKAIVAAGGEPFELPSAGENPFIAGLPAQLPATPEFIASLEKGEKDGDRIYQAWADAAANEEVANVLRQNGREETRHGERDAQVIRLLAANA